jgi:hypothetical protein
MHQSDIFVSIVKRKLKIYKPHEFSELEFDKLDESEKIQVVNLLVGTFRPKISDEMRLSLIWERYQYLIQKKSNLIIPIRNQ